MVVKIFASIFDHVVENFLGIFLDGAISTKQCGLKDKAWIRRKKTGIIVVLTLIMVWSWVNNLSFWISVFIWVKRELWTR